MNAQPCKPAPKDLVALIPELAKNSAFLIPVAGKLFGQRDAIIPSGAICIVQTETFVACLR